MDSPKTLRESLDKLDEIVRKSDATRDVVRTKKTQEIKHVLMTVKGPTSGWFTGIARRFSRANRIKTMLEAEEARLKDEVREAADVLFQAGDEAYKRVIETTSLAFTIAQKEQRIREEFDQKGYLAELEKLTGLAEEQLIKVKEKFTKRTSYDVDSKVLAPREKNPTESVVREGAGERLRQAFSKFFLSWDREFDKVKSKIESEL